MNNHIDDPVQLELLNSSFNDLDQTYQEVLSTLEPPLNITAIVDGRGLACPMPLLKTKMALRTMNEGESVYVLATDPNSQIDLEAFSKQSGLNMVFNTGIATSKLNSLKKLDTIFHLIITKTDGN